MRRILTAILTATITTVTVVGVAAAAAPTPPPTLPAITAPSYDVDDCAGTPSGPGCIPQWVQAGPDESDLAPTVVETTPVFTG